VSNGSARGRPLVFLETRSLVTLTNEGSSRNGNFS
jgi:hypothetical protein